MALPGRKTEVRIACRYRDPDAVTPSLGPGHQDTRHPGHAGEPPHRLA